MEQDENVACACQCARSVRDDDDDPATLSYALNGKSKCRIAFGIEVRIRLVEYHEERIAIECAGECDALPLASGKRRAEIANVGAIALRQAQDQLVHTGRSRGRDHGLGVGLNSKREMLSATVPENRDTSCGK